MQLISGEIFIHDVEDFISKLREISGRFGVLIQAFDASKVAGEEHLRKALEYATRSMSRGRNIAKSLDLEIMLYASGQRQIEKALEMGAKNGENRIVFLINPPCEEAAEEIRKLGLIPRDYIRYETWKRDELIKFFGISEEEIHAVGEEKIPELVLERVVLLDVMK